MKRKKQPNNKQSPQSNRFERKQLQIYQFNCHQNNEKCSIEMAPNWHRLRWVRTAASSNILRTATVGHWPICHRAHHCHRCLHCLDLPQQSHRVCTHHAIQCWALDVTMPTHIVDVDELNEVADTSGLSCVCRNAGPNDMSIFIMISVALPVYICTFFICVGFVVFLVSHSTLFHHIRVSVLPIYRFSFVFDLYLSIWI